MSDDIHIDLTRVNPKQELFLTETRRYVAYGGARGGGKSWAVRVKAAIMATSCPGIRQLIVRRSFAELEENHIRPMRAMLGPAGKYTERDHAITFANGSRLLFGYCDAEGDVLRYQGQEYDIIYIDEATQLTEFQFQAFKGCLRGVNDFPKRMYITCNPGGVGHAWVKRLFIDREYRKGETPEEHTFIQALVYDNRVLMEADPGYVAGLESLPYAQREAWLRGNWDVFAGQYFTEWDREVHVAEQVTPGPNWRWYVSMDYGMDMLAAYLIAVDESGTAWVTDEIYEGRDLGEGHNGLIISQAAAEIARMAEGLPIYEYLAPPDLWNSRQETGRSAADIFAENRIYLTKTSNDRIDGWLAMRERMKVYTGEDGQKTAGLRIMTRCKNLIRTIPLLQYDPKRVNDAATEPHEVTHGPDALRCFCVWMVSAAEPVPAVRREKLMDKFERAQRARKRYGR